MSTPAEFIRRGVYVDYGRRWGYQTQFLCSDGTATLWTNALGIVAAITISRLFRLILRLYRLRFRNYETVHRTPEAILWHQLLDWRYERHGGVITLYEPESDRRGQKHRAPLKLVLKVLLLATSYIGIVSCSALTARLATDSTALSNHAACGTYNQPKRISAQGGSKMLNYNLETQSAALADRCFHAEGGADGCNYFLQQTIPYSTSNASCPFQDATMCLNGGSHVVRFSTGAVDSRAFGINMPKSLQIWRETTCSPLVVNQTFVQTRTLRSSIYYVYYYGHTKDGPPTEITINPPEELQLSMMYRVSTKLTPEQWKPIPGLQARNGSFVSIIFVNSQGVLYPERSDDPIFPATKTTTNKYNEKMQYLRPSRADGVLACVDANRWRVPSLGKEWHDLQEHCQHENYSQEDFYRKFDRKTRGGFALLVGSLCASRTALSIQTRQGLGLAASKMLRSGYSFQLAKEQWKEEARQLFETSLARIQISNRFVAEGSGAVYGGEKVEDPETKAMCDNIFMFRSQGWQNVHVAGSAWIILWSIAIVLLAIPIGEERLLAEHLKKVAAVCYSKVNAWAWETRFAIRKMRRIGWETVKVKVRGRWG